MTAAIVFNRIKGQMKKSNVPLKEFIFLDFDKGIILIDNVKHDIKTVDLSEFKEYITGVKELMITPKKITFKKYNGEKLEY
jgi:hypothetical protein